MYCPKCGFKINENDVFCRKCGTNLSAEASFQQPNVKKGSHKWQKTLIISIAIFLCAAILSAVLFFIFRETPESRVLAALKDLQNAKQTDITITTDADFFLDGDVFSLTQETDVQTDVTDINNPLSAVTFTTDFNSQPFTADFYYKDSFAYTNSSYSKTKTAVDFDEFRQQYAQVAKDVVINPDKDIANAKIFEDDRGNLHAEFQIDSSQFANIISTLLKDFGNDVRIEPNDTSSYLLTFVVDETNHISQMSFDCDFTIFYFGESVNVLYESTYIYNEIPDDFEIVFPKDLDKYDLKIAQISSDFFIRNSADTERITSKHVEHISLCEIDNTYYVKITFDEVGRGLLANLTSDNIGDSLSICVGNNVIMSPTVPAAITEGVVTIPASTYESAEELFETLSK